MTAALRLARSHIAEAHAAAGSTPDEAADAVYASWFVLGYQARRDEELLGASHKNELYRLGYEQGCRDTRFGAQPSLFSEAPKRAGEKR